MTASRPAPPQHLFKLGPGLPVGAVGGHAQGQGHRERGEEDGALLCSSGLLKQLQAEAGQGGLDGGGLQVVGLKLLLGEGDGLGGTGAPGRPTPARSRTGAPRARDRTRVHASVRFMKIPPFSAVRVSLGGRPEPPLQTQTEKRRPGCVFFGEKDKKFPKLRLDSL